MHSQRIVSMYAVYLHALECFAQCVLSQLAKQRQKAEGNILMFAWKDNMSKQKKKNVIRLLQEAHQ